MDIHGGASICIGYNNFLEKFYRSAPIGITVEGSNTLTKNLIIFGQGLNKSHPYISDIFDTIQSENMDEFRRNFNKMVLHTLDNYFSTFNASSAYFVYRENNGCLYGIDLVEVGLSALNFKTGETLKDPKPVNNNIIIQDSAKKELRFRN